MNKYQLVLKRKWFTTKSTIGELYVASEQERECFILEDHNRLSKGESKVYGETAIPTGEYEVILTYSPRFKTVLPLLQSVPGFTGVRIHPGNKPEDTEGCLLPGQTRTQDFVGRSRLAFNALFKKLQEAKRQGKKIFIRIEE